MPKTKGFLNWNFCASVYIWRLESLYGHKVSQVSSKGGVLILSLFAFRRHWSVQEITYSWRLVFFSESFSHPKRFGYFWSGSTFSGFSVEFLRVVALYSEVVSHLLNKNLLLKEWLKRKEWNATSIKDYLMKAGKGWNWYFNNEVRLWEPTSYAFKYQNAFVLTQKLSMMQ